MRLTVEPKSQVPGHNTRRKARISAEKGIQGRWWSIGKSWRPRQTWSCSRAAIPILESERTLRDHSSVGREEHMLGRQKIQHLAIRQSEVLIWVRRWPGSDAFKDWNKWEITTWQMVLEVERAQFFRARAEPELSKSSPSRARALDFLSSSLAEPS